MLEWIASHPEFIFWLVLAIMAGIAEAITVQLVSIWFVLGAASGALLSFLGLPLWTQVLGALGVTISSLVATRKYLKRRALQRYDDSPKALFSGKVAVVTQRITPTQSGQILIEGDYWSAQALDNEEILEVDTRVLVYRIEGTRCMVGRYEV